ncbi:MULTISPECIES: phosphotransferase family protein [unclassified Nocardiopsis]|uniref:phosphotransferase family protein n=1 Tax=unclassified Nocardiopsis TaxID=2649073 RepID=UPI00135A561B|nr:MULTISPECIES: phosphotransferase [unclassified Nocardiopsis]
MDTPTALAHTVPRLLGQDHPATAVQRLRGGSKKGVYRLTLADTTVIAYLWHPDEDYWPATPRTAPETDPFSHASGPDLFTTAHRTLTDLGVRVPRLLALGTTAPHHPGPLAVLEDVPGPTLEERLHHDPRTTAPVLDHLATALRAMHDHTRPAFGKVAHLDRGHTPAAPTCHHLVLQRALADLDETADRDPRARPHHTRLTHTLHTLAQRITPRTEHSLIHGELGPDHVLVDTHGHPVLIDIEGLMFFDHEWEHAFLRLRFGPRHPRLTTRPLDGARTDLYSLAMHLSLVAGPLRLLDGPFPDRDTMRAIAEHNLHAALATTL